MIDVDPGPEVGIIQFLTVAHIEILLDPSAGRSDRRRFPHSCGRDPFESEEVVEIDEVTVFNNEQQSNLPK